MRAQESPEEGRHPRSELATKFGCVTVLVVAQHVVKRSGDLVERNRYDEFHGMRDLSGGLLTAVAAREARIWGSVTDVADPFAVRRRRREVTQIGVSEVGDVPPRWRHTFYPSTSCSTGCASAASTSTTSSTDSMTVAAGRFA